MKESLTYKGYIGSVHICEESKCLWGKVEGIKDLISYEVDTVNELIKGFHEAVDDYLAFCKEVGKEPDQFVVDEVEKKITEQAAENCKHKTNKTTAGEQ